MELFEPDNQGDERTLLTQFLDHHRSILVRKVEGLSQAQLATSFATSDLTIAGVLKHMAAVEDTWFQARLLGLPTPEPWASAPWKEDPDWEFHSAVDDPPEELLRLFDVACERSRAAVDEVNDLDALARKAPRRGDVSLRWILIHMIEETARHNGHVDLLRESIDGSVGD
jgi:uncharacterized damage-inducible protein DinB